jgi:hypothetical protein
MTTDQLRRQFENQLKELRDLMLAHRATDKTKQWQDLYYTFASPKQAMTVAKRVEAIAKVDTTLREALRPLMVKVMQTATDFMIAKEAEDKVKADRKARIAANKAEKAEIKRNPYHRLDPQVAEILKQVAEPYRVQAVQMETIRLTSILEEVKLQAAQHGSFDPNVLFPYVKGEPWTNQANTFKRMEAGKFLKCTSQNYENVWSLKSNTDKVIAEKADEFANDMVNAFVHKTGMKLSGIVDKKNGTHNVTINGGTLKSHWMHFSFEDGSSFDVQSQVVWKTSVNGVHFPQFPTCFRNVKLSTGSKLDLPSEIKMKEQFV